MSRSPTGGIGWIHDPAFPVYILGTSTSLFARLNHGVAGRPRSVVGEG